MQDGIRSFGPVYSTWMFVYERFNSWLCKRALNSYRPEATIMETYRVRSIVLHTDIASVHTCIPYTYIVSVHIPYTYIASVHIPYTYIVSEHIPYTYSYHTHI